MPVRYLRKKRTELADICAGQSIRTPLRNIGGWVGRKYMGACSMTLANATPHRAILYDRLPCLAAATMQS